MNRIQLQLLTQERVRDAETLLLAGQWSGAYYLAGYAVECSLKACIAKLTKQHDYPDKKLALDCYTHDIEDLVRVAGLKSQRNIDRQANQILFDHWLVVKDWNEQARYKLWTESQARELVMAVTDPINGVLQWITGRW